MRKIDKIKSLLNKGKIVKISIENFNKLEDVFLSGYTKMDFCGYNNDGKHIKIPISRCKYFK